MSLAFIYNVLGILFTTWEQRVDVHKYLTMDVVLILLAAAGLYLNARHKYQVSRTLITIAVPFLLFGFAPFFIQTVDVFFWYPYAPTGFMLFAHFLYVKKQNDTLVLILSAFFFLITLFSTDILSMIINNSEVQEFKGWIERYPIVFRRTPITTFVFVFISVHFTMKKSRLFENQMMEANTAKDKFHSIIAHDLRGPFNSMVGFSEALKSNISSMSKEEISQSAEILYATSKNTHRLLENLLEWSQIQIGALEFNPQKINLSEAMAETLEAMSSMAIAKNISLHYECTMEKVELTADSRMVETIIRNLMTNAIKFTNQKGNITLRCSETEDHLLIEVKDNGVGMTEKQVEGLFKEHKKTSTLGTDEERGTGLGLMLVKEFVDLHQGTIEVNSAVGLGTSISFTISKSLGQKSKI